MANGLAAIGIGARDRAAVFSVNSPEWMMVLQVCPDLMQELRGSFAACMACNHVQCWPMLNLTGLPAYAGLQQDEYLHNSII